jgi:quinol monooxygenase YgiN
LVRSVSAGKGDEVAALVAKVRAAAESADEPGTHTYRTTRSEENPDHFLIFEEYKLPNGIVDHGEPLLRPDSGPSQCS